MLAGILLPPTAGDNHEVETMNDGLMTANEHNSKLNGILQEERDQVEEESDCLFPGCDGTAKAGKRYCDTCSGEMKTKEEDDEDSS